jgi:hypothetical protein
VELQNCKDLLSLRVKAKDGFRAPPGVAAVAAEGVLPNAIAGALVAGAEAAAPPKEKPPNAEAAFVVAAGATEAGAGAGAAAEPNEKLPRVEAPWDAAADTVRITMQVLASIFGVDALFACMEMRAQDFPAHSEARQTGSAMDILCILAVDAHKPCRKPGAAALLPNEICAVDEALEGAIMLDAKRPPEAGGAFVLVLTFPKSPPAISQLPSNVM